MRRAPDSVQLEAAPRNKCRVPWQRREFRGQEGRKQHPPGSRQRKQNPISLPGEQNGRKATPRKGRWVPWESEESLLFASRRGLEDAEDRRSAAPGGPRRRAQLTSAAQRAPFPAAAAQPIAQTRRIQPTPLCRCCWNPGGVLGGFGHYAGVEITRTVLSPRTPARATRVLPSKLVAAPDLGVGGGEGERLAPPPPFSSRGRCSSCCQMNPRMGTCNPPPHPQPHTSRSENWEGGAGSKVLEKQELTCKQAVLLSSGLLDHDVDILLNSLLP